jgi:hypothetical protein
MFVGGGHGLYLVWAYSLPIELSSLCDGRNTAMATLALVEDGLDTLVMGAPHEMGKFSARLKGLGFVKDKDGG